MKPLLRWMLDSVLPPACLVCAEPVSADGQLCLACFKTVNFITPPFCQKCGVPFGFQLPGHQDEQLCESCTASPPAFGTARASLRYNETARRIILPLKYGDRTEAAAGLAKLLRHVDATMLQQADLLVPVPLHPSRLRQRRYNQAALLARALGKIVNKPVMSAALIRVRPTKALEGMSAQARYQELNDAIMLKPGINIQGKAILLIDDVMTTGATAHQCAKALCNGGAARVDVLTLARVEDPRLA